MNKQGNCETKVQIPMDGKTAVIGELCIPENARGIIIFTNDQGKDEGPDRNPFITQVFLKELFATLLVHISFQSDEVCGECGSPDKLSHIIALITGWVKNNPETRDLSIGFFGTGSGSAAALKAAATLTGTVKAVVSRSGGTDLAMNELQNVKAAVLLITGEQDKEGITFNREAYVLLHSPKDFKVVSGAGRSFQELGKLGEVAYLASQWYKKYLAASYPVAS